MTIIQNLIERRWSSSRPLSDVADRRSNITGMRTAVTGYEALEHPTVNTCVSLIADGVSMLPVDIYEPRGKTLVNVKSPDVIANPSVYITDTQFREQIMKSWLIQGNAYGLIVAMDKYFMPQQIELIDPFQVSITQNRDTNALEYSINGEKIDPNKILHWPGMLLPGSPIGVSPITFAAKRIAGGLNAQQFGHDYFIKGSKPNGILSFLGKLDPEDAATAKERFVKATQQAYEPVVLSGDMKYTPLNIAAAESQFIESSKATDQDIARYFRTAPEMIGVDSGNSMRYTNVESQYLSFRTYTLNPWIVKLENLHSSLVRKPKYAKINRDAIQAVDTTTRYNAHKIGLESEFLVINEVRAMEDLTPIDGGDTIAAHHKDTPQQDPISETPNVKN